MPEEETPTITTGSAVRSIFRSSSIRRSAFRLGSEAKASRSPFEIASKKPLSQFALRCPVTLSFCVESMLSYHTATASALMNSMLAVSSHSCGWLPEGIVSFTRASIQLQCNGSFVIEKFN